MNIQRYILPGSIAAALHVAFVLGFNEESGPIIRIVEVPLVSPPPKPPEEPIVLPPQEKTSSTEPVQPLGGGPTPPEIEPPLTPLKQTDFTIPEDDHRRAKEKTKLTTIPPTIGPGEFGKLGTVEWNEGINGIDKLDRVPRATVQISPEYPHAMRQIGATDAVTVEFDVDTEGRVVRASAVRFTHREFVEPAVRAVLKWRFEPGRRNGRAVPFRMAIPMEFSLAAD